jgi:solute carrier family 45 protein 1/2/4
LAWIAAPICGALVQPLAGFLSDRYHSEYGKRRPFLVSGVFGIVLCLASLAWVRELCSPALTALKIPRSHEPAFFKTAAIIIVWLLNISIQPVQMAMRALMIECCPSVQQVRVARWASYWTSLGSIVGYIFGFQDLPMVLNLRFLSQFQILSLVSIVALIFTATTTCYLVEEPRATGGSSEGHENTDRLRRQLMSIKESITPRIGLVFRIQFFTWMAWFPFLYYGSRYNSLLPFLKFANAGKLHRRTLSVKVLQCLYYMLTLSDTSASQQEEMLEAEFNVRSEATRFGTYAFLLFAMIAFVTNLILHHLEDDVPNSPMLDSVIGDSTQTEARISSIAKHWTLAHMAFVCCVFSTLFVETWYAGTLVIGISGVSWAMTLWAPYAVIGQEWAEKDESSHNQNHAGSITSLHNVAISTPQIIAAGICGIIFWICKSVNILNPSGWVIRATVCPALLAVQSTRKLSSRDFEGLSRL